MRDSGMRRTAETRDVPRRRAWNLEPLLAPRSIAIVGASESPDSWAPEIERSLRHLGFAGDLIPVNPKYDAVWGRPCRASIEELPRGVDLVVFVVPARVVVDMVDACATRGVRGIMVVSSGFAEAGPEGRALQDELRIAALRSRIPVLGPNVEGFVNYVDHVAPYGTTPPPEPVEGSISVISQSGTVAWSMIQQASDRGVGLRIVLGVGNEAVLGLGDLFTWAAADRATEVVTSYVETMRDVEGIGAGLRALRAARKPVVICAPEGRSEAARRAIVAHTGALAGDTALRDAWLRGHGAVLVDDPVTLFEAALLLSHARQGPRVRRGRRAAVGRRLHVVRGGGGSRGSRAARVRGSDEAHAPSGVAALRLAEQSPRRHGSGRGGDRDVRRRVDRSRARSRRRVRRVRCVPAASAGRGFVGRSRPAAGPGVAGGDRRRVRERGVEPARVRPRGASVHPRARPAVPPRTSGGRGSDRGVDGAAGGSRAGGGGATAAREPGQGAADPPREGRGGGRSHGRGRAGVVRGPAPEGGGRSDTAAGCDVRTRGGVPGGDQGARPRGAAQGAARRSAPRDRQRRRCRGRCGRGAPRRAPRGCARAERPGPGDGIGHRGPRGRRRRRHVRSPAHDAPRGRARGGR